MPIISRFIEVFRYFTNTQGYTSACRFLNMLEIGLSRNEEKESSFLEMKIGIYRKFLILIISAIIALTIFSPQHALSHRGRTRIAVFVSDSLTSTTRTLSGAKKIIKREHPEAQFDKYVIKRAILEDTAIVNKCLASKTDIILTVGTSATEFAKKNFTKIPIVFSSVKYPALSGFVNSSSGTGINITGASLDIPLNIQFSYFKRILPDLKKIGVLYTESTAPLIPSAKIVARQLGLTLIPKLIKEPKELPKALDSLADVTQGLWSVADPELFDPQSTKFILKTTLHKMIPFMGFSRHVVESGALFALDLDYKAIGYQAGEIINKLIDGADASEIKVTSSDVIYFHYNEKTAKYIKVKIPPELAAMAREVYR